MGEGGGFHLEVWARDAGGDLLEERLLDPDELGRLDHVQDLLDLAQKHDLEATTRDSSAQKTRKRRPALRDVGAAHLLLRARFGPILEQPSDDLQGEEHVSSLCFGSSSPEALQLVLASSTLATLAFLYSYGLMSQFLFLLFFPFTSKKTIRKG